MKKTEWIYVNKTTGEETKDKATANRWFESGADIGYKSFSEFFGEWTELMVREH